MCLLPFACGCCHRIWHLLTEKSSRNAVDAAEKFADGEVSDDELNVAAAAAWRVCCYSLGRPGAAAEAVSEATWHKDEYGSSYHLRLLTYNVFYAVGEDPHEYIAQSQLLREIVGNPFRRFAIAPSWLAWSDGTIPKLAQSIYDEKTFDRLTILADALEEAGSTNEDILAHLRRQGSHVRGCWPVDPILGRE